MVRFDLLFVTFLWILTGVEIIADESNENLYDVSFLSAEKEGKVSDEEIAANQAILNESVKENQSGFFGWLGRFFGNIFDEINTDRIVDSLWNKSTMRHEGDEEYKATKGKIDKHLIKKAFRGLFRKYLEGKEINEGTIQKFNGEYDKVKIFADIFKNENNNFEEDSLRLIILEKILNNRENGGTSSPHAARRHQRLHHPEH